jgi:leucyl-tRNA synthetase
MDYNFNEIEAKWQKFWAKNQTFKAPNNSDKPKFYTLSMFPYPSGAGLHVGHPLGYIAGDIYARYKKHKGFNVLHPMGYDSFGLPAEQYAIQTGQHPADTTLINIEGCLDDDGRILPKYLNNDGSIKNAALIEKSKPTSVNDLNYQENIIKGYRKQLDKLGFSFDWSREVRTSNPDYYKWTQWIFIQLFNSWYNTNADKAEDISSLISIFEKEGNTTVNAACDDDIEVFSADDWNAFPYKEKQEILLKYRLTYLADAEVNWCPALGTVLANDEIVNGVSERGGHPVIRKKMTQWMMRITAYAQRLLDGLSTIDWPQPLKDSQTNWIGRSQGASVTFNLHKDSNVEVLETFDDKDTSRTSVSDSSASVSYKIEVFTTRPDTIFGASFMTLAPEHELVAKITTAAQKAEVEAYIKATAKRSERDRMADVKTISGAFTGAYAEHPFSKKPVPIWIGDYVLAGYGTGAVMSVPCGDQRDYDFAKHFGIDIPNIFEGVDISEEAFADKEKTVIANSDFLNGLPYKKAVKRAIFELEQLGQGKGKINYRLRDAVFSRQRYWGEPFPVYYDAEGMPQMIAEEHLPIELPEVEKYLPTETGEPPLGNAKEWHWLQYGDKGEIVSEETFNNSSPSGRLGGALELNTMPGWAGSSQYFNRYMDPHNSEAIYSKEAIDYWEDVDLYIGGSEHATGHLLYARFWQKFLFDKGTAPKDEFAKKLINQGMITGTSAIVYRISGTNKYVSKGLKNEYEVEELRIDINLVNSSDEVEINFLRNWQPDYQDAEFILENEKYIVGREIEKMSKRWYNVVNPDAICDEYGADSLRLYEMFLGPLEQSKPWNTSGITGVHGFLKKLWRLYHSGENGAFCVTDSPPSEESGEALKTLHKTIKKVEEDIESFSFNTSVSTFMICVNELTAQKCHSKAILEPLAILVSPYAPHIAEELWEKLGHTTSIAEASFPIFDGSHLVESSKEYPISFNGKMRFTMELPLDLSKEEIESAVMAHEKTQAQLAGRTPKKVIVVPGKIVNIVG